MHQQSHIVTRIYTASNFFITRLFISAIFFWSVMANNNIVHAADDCSNQIGNGATLVTGPDGPEGADYDQVFRSLTIDPADANVVFVGTERNGIMRTTDAGKTWSWLRSGLRSTDFNGVYPEVWDIAIHPEGYKKGLYAATLDSPGPVAGDYPSSIAGVYKSTDGGETWVRSNCGLVSSRAVSVRYDPLQSNNIVLAIEGGTASFSQLSGQYFDGGLFLSQDAGALWQSRTLPTNNDLNGYWHMRSYGSTTTSFLTFGFNYNTLSENVGFVKSSDGGATWSALNTTLKNKLITSFDVSSDGLRILANERDSFSISKSDNGGTSFTTISNNANGPIRMSPVDKDIVLFASNDKLYRSTDGLVTIGNNGQPVIDSTGTINDIEFSTFNPAVVYVAETGYNIWKSTNSGQTFTRIINLRTDIMSKLVSLSLDSDSYTTGGNLVLRADTRQVSSGSQTRDVYLYVQLPDQTKLYMQPDGAFTASPVAIVSNWAPSIISGNVFQYTFSGSEPAGSYSWSAGFANPGTMDFSDSLVTVPFTYTP